jgi:formin 2
MPPTAAAAAAHPPGPRALRSPSPPLGVGGVALHHPSSHPRDAASLRPPTSPALSPARAPASRAPDGASDSRDEQQGQVPLSAAPTLPALALWLLPPGCFRQPLPRRAPHPPPRDQDPKRMPHTAEAAAHPPWPRPARPLQRSPSPVRPRGLGGVGRRAPPPRESPQDAAAFLPPTLLALSQAPRPRQAPPMPGMSGGAESRPLPRRPSRPSRSGSYLLAVFGSHFPFARHILLLHATGTQSAGLLLLPLQPTLPRTLPGPPPRAPSRAPPAQPAPGGGGRRAPPPLESPQDAIAHLLPPSPGLSPAGAPARRAPALCLRCLCPGCLVGPSPAVYRAALPALALRLIPPGCFRQPLPLCAPHPPPPRDREP